MSSIQTRQTASTQSLRRKLLRPQWKLPKRANKQHLCLQCKQAGVTFSVYRRHTEAALVSNLRICSATEKRRSDETGSLCSEMTRRATCLFFSKRRLVCFGTYTEPEHGGIFKLTVSGTRDQKPFSFFLCVNTKTRRWRTLLVFSESSLCANKPPA